MKLDGFSLLFAPHSDEGETKLKIEIALAICCGTVDSGIF
jgi:hypothetical protein